MKTKTLPLLAIPLLAGLAQAPLEAQDDPVPDLSGSAETYVAAYNKKDLDAIVALYTEEAEIVGGDNIPRASGRDEIRELFAASFEEFPDRKISLDVSSARQIAENVVVEEGIALFSDSGGEDADSDIPYSAVLVKGAKGEWLIANSRELASDALDTDPLAALHSLEGDWTTQGDQMRIDMTLMLAPSGRFLHGTALVATSDEGDMETEIRIGYDAARRQIRWWTFDEAGGFAQGSWQPLGKSWIIQTNGVTALGETNSATQVFTFEREDEIRWNSTHRFLDGVALPKSELRLVRRPPVPSLTFEGDDTSSGEGIEEFSEGSSESETSTAPNP
jgi:uncharacterized protein (TIGR02246 family)